MPDTEFTLHLKEVERNDPRLGRLVAHDSRSRRFSAPARDPRTLQSTRHEVHVPVLQQLNEGSCTGHGIVAVLASGPFWEAGQHVLTGDAQQAHEYARGVYSEATRIDRWPGFFDLSTGQEDTGSDGLSVAKVLQTRGLISGYEHAFSLNAALTALAERPVIVGTNWLSGMFNVASDGHVQVTGSVEGGHEYALDEIDVERQRAWLRNSWGADWGLGGRAWMTWDELGELLAADGDCTVLVPLAEPAPVPTPPKPPVDDKPLQIALSRFLKTHAVPAYLKPPAESWLKSKE